MHSTDKKAYTLKEVADLMGFSRWTVARIFKKEAGVIRNGRTLRVPRAVYERVLRRLTIR